MNKFKQKVLPFIIMNLILVVILFVCIIPTLFYTQVPITEQHLWFGNDLHKYLVYQHSLVTGIWLILVAINNYVVIMKVKDLK